MRKTGRVVVALNADYPWVVLLLQCSTPTTRNNLSCEYCNDARHPAAISAAGTVRTAFDNRSMWLAAQAAICQ